MPYRYQWYHMVPMVVVGSGRYLDAFQYRYFDEVGNKFG